MHNLASRTQHWRAERQQLIMIAAVAPTLDPTIIPERKPGRIFDNVRPGAEWYAVYYWLDPEREGSKWQ